MACNSIQFECLEMLIIQPTIDIDQADAQGRTALFSACNLVDHRFTEALLQAGANPDHQDKEGKTYTLNYFIIKMLRVVHNFQCISF